MEVNESFVLRRFLGGVSFGAALPVLFIAFLAFAANAFLWAVLSLGLGLLFVKVAYSAFRFGHSPRVRLRVTDQSLWVLPDESDWNLLKDPKPAPVTVSWNEIDRVDDGGVLYGYRKLRFSTVDTEHFLNTTFLDSDPRSVVFAVDQKLRQNRKQLVEQKIGMVGLTDSRTSLFGLVLLLVIYVLGKFFERIRLYRNSLLVFGAASPLLAASITYYLSSANGQTLNLLLSFRPRLFQQFVEGVSTSNLLIGWRIEEGVENLFLMLLSGVGLVALVAILVSVSRKIYQMKLEVIPFAAVLMVLSVFESFLVGPEIPVSVLFVHLLFSKSVVRK